MSTMNEATYSVSKVAKEKSDTKHQDRFLRTLFKDPKRALELCGAINGIDYPTNTQVELYNLDHSLMKRYNDLAIGINDQLLFMIEHSSTISPNYPLRLLGYISDTLHAFFIETKKLYRNKRYQIPEPKCFVLYNGAEPLKERELKLSKSFKTHDDSHQTFDLELTVKIIDVNYGSDSVLLTRSKSLSGYAYLIDQIRRSRSAGISRDKSIQKAIAHCIKVGVLADFLKAHYEEAAKMLNWEYDQKAEHEAIREDGIEIGEERGRQEERKKAEAEKLEEKKNVAKKLLSNSVSVDIIIASTSLSEENILSLVSNEGYE